MKDHQDLKDLLAYRVLLVLLDLLALWVTQERGAPLAGLVCLELTESLDLLGPL